MAPDPFAQDAWIRARDRFTQDLSESERSVYHQSSLEMIFYDASSAQKRHENSSISRNFVSKLQPLTGAIEQYGEALDVFVNAYPLALSPLWGSIRVVLIISRLLSFAFVTLANEFGKYFEKVVDMFERIGDILPRFRAYERLFPNNERLVQSLSIVYVDILKFCSDIKTIFRRGKRSSVINMKIFSKLVWKPFDMQFGDRLNKFREHKRTVEKEAELSHMIESAESRALVLANRLQMERERREQDRIKMLSRLSDVSHEDLHKIQREAHHPGTGLWVLQTQEYIDWRSSSESVGLCCYGIPGCGKSVLVSTCVEDLLQKQNESEQRTLVYYYCSNADPRSLLKSQILGSLLRQLLLKGALSEQTERRMLDAFLKSGRNPTDEALNQYILSAAERCQDLYIVFDGLDECEKDTTRSILDIFLRFTEWAPGGAHILLTCREESHIMKATQKWPQVHLGDTILSDDIRLFIACSVRSKIDNGELEITDSALENEIVEKLVDKAHGMFLWVHFQLIDLCACLSPAQIRTTLENLPDGLGETYAKILFDISRNPRRAYFARKVFLWLACARRPLRIDELREAVAFDKSDKVWDAEKIPDADLLLQSCQSLAVRDHNNATVRFAHHTVCQYLTTVDDSIHTILLNNSGILPEPRFIFGLEEAEQAAAHVCIAYLNFSDFETGIVPRIPDLQFQKNGILGPGGPGTIPSTLGIGKPVVNVMYRILGGRVRPTAPEVDFARHLDVHRKAEDPKVIEKYALKDYITAYWPWHVDAGKDLRSLTQLDKLVTEKILPFEFRPWGVNRHFGPYGCNSCWGREDEAVTLNMTSMIHWATENGLSELLQYYGDGMSSQWNFRNRIVAHLEHEKYSNQSMLIACRYGQTKVIKFLEDHQGSHDSSPDFCLAAAASGHAETLEYLMEKSKMWFRSRSYGRNVKIEARLSSDPEMLQRMLFNAASDGHASVVNVIISVGKRYLFNLAPAWQARSRVENEILASEQVNMFLLGREELSRLTPLHSASANGHYDVVCLLLQNGLDVDCKETSEGATALHFAAKNGHARVAIELVSRGASIECEDNDSATPLFLAAEQGHTMVIKGLLKEMQSALNVFEPLERAARYGHISVVQELLSHVQLRDVPQEKSKSPLHLDSDEKGFGVINCFVPYGQFLYHSRSTDYAEDMAKYDGIESLTPLMWAAAYGHNEIVDYLTKSPVALDQALSSGFTATRFAKANGHTEILKMLYERGAKTVEEEFVHSVGLAQ